jgi:hypothetical protein
LVGGQNNVLIDLVEAEGPVVDDKNNESNNTENHHVQIGTIDNHSQTVKLTTTRKLTTTSKPNVTTTRIVTTTKPTTNPAVFSFCRDTSSSAATGKIQLNKTSQTDTSSCVFDIVAPPGQQIQFSCSAISFNNYTSKMAVS